MQTQSPSTFKILLTSPEVAERMDELAGIAPDAELIFCPTQGDVDANVADADVIAGQIGAAALAEARKLVWVHSWAAGPNSQLFPEMQQHPVILTCSKGNGAIPLAEHALLLMMMLNRDVVRWIDAQRERRWAPRFHGELAGLTCGILGTGASAQDLALKAKACHMRVLGLARTLRAVDHFDGIFTKDELASFLAEIDFLVVTVPETAETRSMIGEREFALMKPGAFYISQSRGGIADDAALLRALQSGTIAGAGLDAHAVEPLPADSPFWTAPNTIITPHNGATTAATKIRGYEIFRDNLARFVRGARLTNVVDKMAGY